MTVAGGCGSDPGNSLICPRVLHVDDSITRKRMAREGQWSEAIAVGNLNFVEKVKSELGSKAAHAAALRPFNSSKVQKFNVSTPFGPEINRTYASRRR